ncbi:MAG: hypothetical protein Q8Q31_03845 [Nanoarchaeota archaeon]|nr:hypothetical protein [Nanoarchaeota archaeon]
MNELLDKLRTITSLQESNTGQDLVIADTSGLLSQGTRDFDNFISRRYGAAKQPVILLPFSVEAEMHAHPNSGDRMAYRVQRLQRKHMAIPIDVKDQARSSEFLHHELSFVLPAISLITTKSILDSVINVFCPTFFADFASAIYQAAVVTPHSPEENCLTPRVEATVDELNGLIARYPCLPSRPHGITVGEPLTRQYDSLDYLIFLKQILLDKYEETFKNNLELINADLNGESIDFTKLNTWRRGERFRGSYSADLRKTYNRFVKNMFSYLLYMGLQQRLLGKSQESVKGFIADCYHHRFGPPSDTDCEVAAVYAYPLRQIAARLPKRRLEDFSGIRILTRDTDIIQLVELRRDYVKGR